MNRINKNAIHCNDSFITRGRTSKPQKKSYFIIQSRLDILYSPAKVQEIYSNIPRSIRYQKNVKE